MRPSTPIPDHGTEPAPDPDEEPDEEEDTPPRWDPQAYVSPPAGRDDFDDDWGCEGNGNYECGNEYPY